MKKIRLTNPLRTSIHEWMLAQLRAKHAETLEKLKLTAIEAANKAIRVRYPEADMAVLRKYKCTMVKSLVRFVDSSSSEFFALDFPYGETTDGLADTPDSYACRTDSEAYPISAAGHRAIAEFTTRHDACNEEKAKKSAEYYSFLYACTTVQQVNDIVPLPEEMRNKYLAGTSLIALSDETLATIKRDFKAAA
jgi:hypothetical protein